MNADLPIRGFPSYLTKGLSEGVVREMDHLYTPLRRTPTYCDYVLTKVVRSVGGVDTVFAGAHNPPLRTLCNNGGGDDF